MKKIILKEEQQHTIQLSEIDDSYFVGILTDDNKKCIIRKIKYKDDLFYVCIYPMTLNWRLLQYKSIEEIIKEDEVVSAYATKDEVEFLKWLKNE